MRLDRLLERVPAYAGWILAATLALSAIAVATLVDLRSFRLRLEVDPSADRMLPDHDPAREFYDRVRRQFGADETLVVAVSAEDIFRADVLTRIQRMTVRLGQLDGVHHVLSLTSAVDVRMLGDDLEVAPFVSEVPREPAALEALRARFLANPIYGPTLISHDARTTILLVYLRAMSNREYMQSGLGAQIASVAEQERGDAELWITGGPRVREETARVLLGEAFTLSLAIGAVLAGVLILAFRRPAGVLLPLATIGIAVLWTLGLVVAFEYPLNLVTALVPPLLTTLGLSYSVHVVAEHQDIPFEEHGGDPRLRVGQAMRHIMLPVLLTGLTTAVGFASLLLSPLGAIREFGGLAMLGVLLTMVASLTFTPAMLVFLPQPPERAAHASGDAVGRLLARVARFDYDHRRWIFLAAFLCFAVGIAGATRLRFGSQMIEQFREDAPVRVHFEKVNDRLNGVNPFYVVIESESPEAFKEPANLEALHAVEQWLLAQPEIGGVISLVDYLSLVHRGLRGPDAPVIPETRPLVSQLLLFGASDELERFVDTNYQIANVQVRARVYDSAEVLALTGRIEQRLAELPRHLHGAVTGTSVVLNRALDAVVRGQATSIIAALVIIYLLLAAMFVSLRIGFVAMIPNVIPVAAFFGVLGFTGLPLDTATSLVAPMVLGIAVDDTIHHFARFIRDAKRLGDERSATVSAMLAVGRPVTYSAAALCLGFLMLNFSELRTQHHLGTLAAGALAFGWLTDMLLTPALCARLRIATLWDLIALDLGPDPHQSIPVFSGLRAAQARIVGSMGTMLQIRAGERLYHAGEPGDALYVVIDGALRASLPQRSGPLVFEVMRRGDVIGEVGLFHTERTTDVDAVESSRLLRIGEDEIAQLGKRYPRIAAVVFRNLNAVLAARLTRTTRWLHDEAERATREQDAPLLVQRGRALEDVFFQREAERFRSELRLREMAHDAREALVDAAGLADTVVVNRLVEIGIRADTLAALTLIPLVEVAWADGRLDHRERSAVLAGAEGSGIHRESPSYGLLELWLERRPEAALLETWRSYIDAVSRELSVESRLRLRGHILGRARAVAEAAGGFLGVATISRQEERMLQELERAFEVA